MTAVLLIDDHAMFREALLLSLSQALPGVTVHPASNGAEALAVLQAQPQIGSVIMDYYLPDLGGSALLKRLKQLRPGIRVLVLSASEDPDDRERVMAAGRRAFCTNRPTAARCWTRWSRSASRHAPTWRRRRRRASRPRRCRRRWTTWPCSAP